MASGGATEYNHLAFIAAQKFRRRLYLSRDRLRDCGLLIDRKADVCAKSKSGDTVLMIALLCAHTPVAALLLDKKADVNVGNNNGVTALMIASWGFHTDIVSKLIDRNADIEARDKDGNSALAFMFTDSGEWSHQGRHASAVIPTVKLLIQSKADLYAQNAKGQSPLTLAEATHKASARMLRQAMLEREKSVMAALTRDVPRVIAQNLNSDFARMYGFQGHSVASDAVSSRTRGALRRRKFLGI
jgi:ankyrin repeat protein